MTNRAVITAIAILVAINVVAGLVWITVSEVAPLNRASEKYGHVADADERIALMQADMDVERAKAQPYAWAFAMITGVNAAIALAFIARTFANRRRAARRAPEI